MIEDDAGASFTTLVGKCERSGSALIRAQKIAQYAGKNLRIKERRFNMINARINSAWNGLLPLRALDELDQTAFMSRCRSGVVSRRELEVFLVQQHHYSRHFTRYLCALLANLSNELDRLALTKNLFEEMGLGDMGDEPHVKIYRDMLFALDLDPEMSPAFPETIALVSTMLRLCSAPNPIVGLGALCLGAEAIVPHVYAQILNGLVARGFPMQQLRFFPLHIDGDDDHALTMKGIIDRELSENPEQSVILAATAEDCIVQRARFFEAISSRALLGQGESAYAI